MDYDRTAIIGTLAQGFVNLLFGFIPFPMFPSGALFVFLLLRSLQGIFAAAALTSSISMLIRFFPKTLGIAVAGIVFWITLGFISSPYIEFVNTNVSCLAFASCTFLIVIVLVYACKIEHTDPAKAKSDHFFQAYRESLWRLLRMKNAVFCAGILVLSFCQLSFFVVLLHDAEFVARKGRFSIEISSLISLILSSMLSGLVAQKASPFVLSCIGLICNFVFLNVLQPFWDFSSLNVFFEIPIRDLFLISVGVTSTISVMITSSFRYLLRASQVSNLEIGAGLIVSCMSLGLSAGVMLVAILLGGISLSSSVRPQQILTIVLFIWILSTAFFNILHRRWIRKAIEKDAMSLFSTAESSAHFAIGFRAKGAQEVSVSRDSRFIDFERSLIDDKMDEELSPERKVEMDKKRKFALNEFVQSEKSYVLYLQFLVAKWVIPLENLSEELSPRDRCSSSNVRTVFKDLKTLKNLHSMFYDELVSAVLIKPDFSNLGIVSQKFVTIIFRFLSFFKVSSYSLSI